MSDSTTSLTDGTYVRVVTGGPNATHFLNPGDVAVVLPTSYEATMLAEVTGQPVFVIQLVDNPKIRQFVHASDVESVTADA